MQNQDARKEALRSNRIEGKAEVDRIFEVSINPRRTPYGPFSLELISLPKWTGFLLKNAYDNWAELCNALDRLGIAENEKMSILNCVDRGGRYQILGLRVPREIAIAFGGG